MLLPTILLLHIMKSQSKPANLISVKPTELTQSNGLTTLEVFQQDVNKTVFYKVQPIDLNNYLNCQVDLKQLTNQNYSQMILFYNFQSPAHLDSSLRPISPSIDQNSLQQQKTKYNLIIPPNLLVAEEDIFFTMMIPNNSSYYYTLQITRSPTFPCISNCSSTSSGGGSGQQDNTNILLVYFLVSVAVVLLLTWIILTLIRIKYQRQNRVQTESQTVSQVRRRKRATPKQALKMETIDEFMPRISYFDIFDVQLKNKERVPGDSCSVCLLEFEEDTMCRMTPCEHIFHSECLEQWLKKHENCPICRSELGEKDLRSPLKLKLEDHNLMGGVQINYIQDDDSPTHNQTNLILTASNSRHNNQLRVVQGSNQNQSNIVNFSRIMD